MKISLPQHQNTSPFWDHLFSDDDVRDMDATMIKEGMPSETLMELAGHQCAVAIQNQIAAIHEKNIVILCGGGNNGGDGYVIARWLHLWGFHVSLCPLMEPKTTDAQRNAQRCKKLNIHHLNWQEAQKSISNNPPNSVVIESILGTGQNRLLTGLFADVSLFLYQSQSCVVSVDTPLGFGRGEIWTEHPVNPDLCLNIGASKWSLFTGHLTGKIINIDIGFSQLKKTSTTQRLAESIFDDMPKISKTDAKWNRGHVAILAKKGAAVLAAHSALACGAGLVTLLVDKEDIPYLIGLRPEIILATPDQLDPKRHDALIVGPALGFSKRELVQELWINFPNPALFDADALRILNRTEHTSSLHPRVITPHVSEAAALLGIKKENIVQKPFLYLQQLSVFGTCVLKGHHSKISDGDHIFVNPIHAPLLATAGSGDVLCGVIGTLLAKGLSPLKASSMGVFLHAKAGTHMKMGDGASEIIDHIKLIVSDLC